MNHRKMKEAESGRQIPQLAANLERLSGIDVLFTQCYDQPLFCLIRTNRACRSNELRTQCKVEKTRPNSFHI